MSRHVAAQGSTTSALASVLGRGRRLFPTFVWMAALTMAALVLLGTLVLPQLRIPDEKHHADMVLMVQQGAWLEDGWPGIGDRLLDPEIIAASLSLGPRELALRENRAAQHPPLFYVSSALASWLVTLSVDDPDLTMRLWSFRLISVLASAALPLIYYLIASELTTNQPVRLASAVTPLAIPGITLRNGPMINTDALLILLTSLSVLFAIRIAKGDLTVRTGIALGLSTGLAILTKAHGLLVIPVIVIAYLIRAFRDRRVTPEWWRSVALSGGITLVVGGWWWIRNVLRSGAIQPVRHLEPVTEPLVFDWLAFDWAGWFGEAARRLQSSFWGGGFALPGTRYMMFYWVLTVLVIVGSAIGWAISRDRAASSVSGLFALLLIPAVLLTSALLSAERGRVVGVQGRYFFPGLAGIAPLVVLGIGSVMRRASRWLPALVVAASAAMTLLAIGYMFQRYWSESGSGLDYQWSNVVASSPFGAVVSSGLLVVTVAAFVILFAAAVSIGLKGGVKSRTSGLEPSVSPVAIIESEQSA